MTLIQGSKLNSATRAEVLRAFIYRWTIENASRESAYANTGKPTMPLQTDEKWLAEHAFYVNKNGRLAANRRHAEPAFMAE